MSYLHPKETEKELSFRVGKGFLLPHWHRGHMGSGEWQRGTWCIPPPPSYKATEKPGMGSQPARSLERVCAISSWDFPTLYDNQNCGNLIMRALPTSWSCPDDTFPGIISSSRGLGTRGVQGPALEDMFHSQDREVPGAMVKST